MNTFGESAPASELMVKFGFTENNIITQAKKLLSKMRKLGDTDVFNKTVALRVDLNVPVKDGKVLDDTRILAITQTLQYLKKQKSKTVLISHFGRPEPGIHDQKFSLLPVAKRLEEIFNTRVPLFQTLKDVNFDNDISLVENIRFLSGEVDNDPRSFQPTF